MRLQDYFASSEPVNLILGVLVFYMLPYFLLTLGIDLIYYYTNQKKDFVYPYSPALAFILVMLVHLIWALIATSRINAYLIRIQLSIIVLPLCWISTEILRYKFTGKSITDIIDLEEEN